VFAGCAVAVGQVEVYTVAVDGDQRCAFDGLVAGEVGKGHATTVAS
jgi:hypothetical protein